MDKQAFALISLFTVISLSVNIVQAQSTQDSAPRSAQAERQAFTAELDNIRALPNGYSAICESGDLKLRSASSATFVIKKSLLCELSRLGVDAEHQERFTLCSNSPDQRSENTRPKPVLCTELVIERLEL